MAGIQDAARRCLQQQAHELAGCLLYLDAGAAEAVATGVGLVALQELGVAAACDLASASPADLSTAALLLGSSTPVRRVACFITTLLAEAEAAVLAACTLHTAAAQFTVLCAASQAAHHDELPALYTSSCYAAFGSAWQQQLNEVRRSAGQGPSSLVIVYCPLLLCPLSSSAFVLSSASAASALPRAGQLAAGYSTSAVAAAVDDSDDEALQAAAAVPRRRSVSGVGGCSSKAPAAGLHLLAHTLTGITALLGYRPEAFALGPCSRLVCQDMAFVPSMAEDAPPAALVLVDRLLDPVSPSQHADLLVQRLYDLLQHQPGLSTSSAGLTSKSSSVGSSPFLPLGMQLPMPSLDQPAAEASAVAGGRGPDSLLSGSLRHPDDAQADRWLEFLLSRRGRDGPLFVRKWLREAARKENVAQQQRFKPGSICAAELRCLADGLRRQSPASAHRHAPLLQLAEAVAAAVEGPHAEAWEALQREERALLFACTESADAAAAHLVELCRLAGAPASPLQLADVVALVLAAYCLLPDFLPWCGAGEGGMLPPFQLQQERQLQEALVEAVMASTIGSSNSHGGSDEPGAGVPFASTPAGPLERLCRCVAAAKEAAGKAAGDSGWEIPEEINIDGSGSGVSGGDGVRGSGGGGTGMDAASLPALRLEARDMVEALLGRMQEVALSRHSQLKHVKHLVTVSGDSTPQPTPLLRQIVEHVLRDQPLPDLHAGATSLAGLLRSGLGHFGLQAVPKPSDSSTVILFVLGGISVAELHAILEAVDEHTAQHSGTASTPGSGASTPSKPAPRIIVGATTLLQPRDPCSLLFADLQAD